MSLFGFGRANYILDCAGQVTNSNISNSTIDMNGGVITSHGNPVNGSDVVNKDYVDASLTSPTPFVQITLTGTAYTTILSSQSGSALILITNVVTDGPSGSFLLSKSEPTREPSIVRLTTCSGLTTDERLEIKWDTNTGIELRKNGSAYDGLYNIKYVL